MHKSEVAILERFRAGEYDTLPLLITPTTAEAAIGISSKHLLRMADRGEIRAVQIGRRWKLNRDDLLAVCGLRDKGAAYWGAQSLKSRPSRQRGMYNCQHCGWTCHC